MPANAGTARVTPVVADASPAPAIDAAATGTAPDAAVDPEAARRAGRKTGVGAPGDKPEVATEALVVAIAEGKVSAESLIDPTRGFIEYRSLPGGTDEPSEPTVKQRHCGKRAAAALVRYAKELVDLEKRWAEYGKNAPPDLRQHVLRCSNDFLVTPNPDFGATDDENHEPQGGHPFAYADCSSSGAGEYDANHELMFAPDPDRGLRAVGVVVWESGARMDWRFKWFAPEALKAGKVCK